MEFLYSSWESDLRWSVFSGLPDTPRAMLSASRRLLSRRVEGAISWPKAHGASNLRDLRAGRSFVNQASRPLVQDLRKHFIVKVRGFCTSTKKGEEENTIEVWLDKASSFAVLLSSSDSMSIETMKNVAEEQIKAMREALKLAVAQNAETKEEIFVALLKTMDMHGRRDWIRKVVAENPGMMEREAVVRAEVGAIHAEAICDESINPALEPSNASPSARGPKAALALSQHYSDLLFSLTHVPAESLVVSLINVGLLMDALQLSTYAIRVYKRAHDICVSPKSSIKLSSGNEGRKDASSASNSKDASAPSFDSLADVTSLSSITNNVKCIVHSKLASALLTDPKLGKDAAVRSEAKSHLESVVNMREASLKQNMGDEGARDAYVKAVEELSSFFDSSDASRLVWERASIVLEYGGDADGWLSKEIEASQHELNEAQGSDISASNLSALQHRHAKALLACNTQDSLNKALKLIDQAEATYRQLEMSRELLDVLEDKMAIYESLSQLRSSSSNKSGTDFIKEQIDVTAECLSLSGQLNGPFSFENAKFLVNLSIFASADRQIARAVDLAKAAVYICEKAGVPAEDEIFSRAKSVLSMLSLSPKERKGRPRSDDSKL